NGDQLRVAGRVVPATGAVPSLGQQPAAGHHHRADGHLVLGLRRVRLLEGPLHPQRVRRLGWIEARSPGDRGNRRTVSRWAVPLPTSPSAPWRPARGPVTGGPHRSPARRPSDRPAAGPASVRSPRSPAPAPPRPRAGGTV